MDVATTPTDLSDSISGIYASLQQKSIARLQRGFRLVGDEYIPTGQTRWQIITDAPLKKCLVSAVGRDRAIVVGGEVAKSDDGLKIHRMIELLEPFEVSAFEEILAELKAGAGR